MTYREILNLDYRDFKFWLREAEKVMIGNRLDAMAAARMAMAEMPAYRQAVSQLEWSLKLIELEEKQEAEAIGKDKK
jgi:hypothetical protein